jgi:YhcH/YjgK/YiaL family protein
MIISSQKECSRYFGLNPLFKDAFQFILNNELKEFTPGEYEIIGRSLYVIIAEGHHDESYKPKLEIHKKYIDIQAALDGDFPIAWKALDDCSEISDAYSEEKDYELYSDSPEFIFPMIPGNFCILFPEDAHAALSPEVYVKKAVFKVAVG